MSNPNIYISVIGGIGIQSENIPITADPDDNGVIGGGVNVTTVSLTSAQIAALGDGLSVVTAQGAGTVSIPTFAAFEFNPGSQPFADDVGFGIGPAGQGHLTMTGSLLTATATENMLTNFIPSSLTLAIDGLVNQPIQIVSNANGYTGGVATYQINDAGVGHNLGDIVTCSLSGRDIDVTINTVDGGGGVLTCTPDLSATGLIAGLYPQTSTDGAGSDFILSIDTITHLSDGTGTLYIEYKVLNVG